MGAAEQLLAIALQLSPHNKRVEYFVDGQVVIEEVESSAATSQDSFFAKDISVSASSFPVLFFGTILMRLHADHLSQHHFIFELFFG